MAKNKFKNNIQQAQSATPAGSQKSISPLMQRFIPTAEQTAKSIDVASPEWSVQTLESLRDAISPERREELEQVLHQFIELGNATQAALKSAEEAEKLSSENAQAFAEQIDQLTAKKTELGGFQKDLETRVEKVLIDEAALIDTLQNKRIAGAGLDVYHREPLGPDYPLYKLDNVVLTPHLGYVVEESFRAFYGDTVANILAWLDGKPIRVANAEALGLKA